MRTSSKAYIKLIILLLSFIIGGVSSIYVQEKHTKFNIEFRAGSDIIDLSYSKNAANIEQIVSFYGSASPEGSYRLNYNLANKRSDAFEKLVRNRIDIQDSIIVHNDGYIQWEYLKYLVNNSQIRCKDKVLSILDEEAKLVDYYYPYSKIDNRILKIMRLDGGRVWKQMKRSFFKKMRNAGAVLITCRKKLPPLNVPDIVLKMPEASTASHSSAANLSHPYELATYSKYKTSGYDMECGEYSQKLYLKSNAVGISIGIANIAAEIDLAKHWSASIPVYYSAWNYFKSTIKLRTFAVMPEVRYWFSEKNNGLFAGIHFGMAYYNVALNGSYRFQDQGKDTPAIGGGINIGYRMPISKNNRWLMEFALGAGVYDIKYDMFHNTPNTKDGLLVRSVKKLMSA